LPSFHACHLKHNSTGSAAIGIVVVVIEIHHLSNARLDYDLGAIVAGKERNINGGTSHICRTFVQDSIYFCMSDVAVFFVKF
jgi:hypothetical protein